MMGPDHQPQRADQHGQHSRQGSKCTATSTQAARRVQCHDDTRPGQRAARMARSRNIPACTTPPRHDVTVDRRSCRIPELPLRATAQGRLHHTLNRMSVVATRRQFRRNPRHHTEMPHGHAMVKRGRPARLCYRPPVGIVRSVVLDRQGGTLTSMHQHDDNRAAVRPIRGTTPTHPCCRGAGVGPADCRYHGHHRSRKASGNRVAQRRGKTQPTTRPLRTALAKTGRPKHPLAT